MISQDWMLEKTTFDKLNQTYGPFSVDGCCNDSLDNSQLKRGWSNAFSKKKLDQ